ncbi:hypothetical protein BX600DRAFT_103749 [Xylariales sp. PMI_506]|nr:hypothetical protein BX600DRAFT_103749 [Xylariales sp. PMI_506]
MSQTSNRVPLLSLPTELHAEIFVALPDLWTAISLGLTCRELNGVCRSNEAYIKGSLRDRFAAAFLSHYTFHTSLHIPTSGLKLSPPLVAGPISP